MSRASADESTASAVRHFDWRLTRAALSVLAGVVLMSLTGCESLLAKRAESRYPAVGRVVDLDGRRLQIDCRGSGSPTVLLEAGGNDILGSLGWAHVHDALAENTRVCAYSRPGYLWSSSPAEPVGAEDGARDLHHALEVAGEAPPYLLVSHSRGALNHLVFADLYGSEVAALLFAEPRPPTLEARRAAAGVAPGSEQPLWLPRLARWLRWSGLPRLFTNYCEIASASAAAIATCKAYFPHSLDGIVAENAALERVRARAAQVRSLGDRPVLVLSRQLPLAALPLDTGARARLDHSEQL